MNAMSQPLCFDIDYSRSYYRPFLSRKSKWSKIQSTVIVLLLKIIQFIKQLHHLQGFQLQNHTVTTASIHMLVSINY